MGFQVVTTYTYSGKPSKGRDILQIWLKDETCLVATDDWSAYPAMELALHPEYLHAHVAQARRELVKELTTSAGRPEARHLKDAGFRYILPQNLRVGHPGVTVTVRYGVWQPTRRVEFRSPVVRLVAP